MKQLLRKKFPGFLMLALAVAFFGMTFPSLAQDQVVTETPPTTQEQNAPSADLKKSDVAITNLWAINSTPAPNGLVDFTVFYGNLGTEEAAVNTELKITYDTKNLYNISLGDPVACTDDKTAVICHYNTLNAGESNTVGFTANVVPTATPDTQIFFVASIKSDTLENDKKNDFATLSVTVTSIEKGGRMTGVGNPADLQGGALGQATTKGNVWLFDVKNDPNWKTDALSTAGLKFLIRGKEALAWTLNITDSGFRNPAIQSNYLKVLTVVNGLFILGLLAIAAMWMFSLFIPRRYLRQVIVLYGIAVLFVNFALPINQLLIDGSNLLQRTFIGATNISDLVDTPTYNNPNSVGYQSQSGTLKQAASDKMTLSLGTTEQQANKDIAIGKLQQGFQTPVLTGMITASDGKLSQIGLNSTGNDPTLFLNTNQGLELTSEKTFNPNEENRVFAFSLLLLTGVAYFGMALTFILRIVILWALMIVSPILFLLAIFRSTRGYFYNWLSLYARWLLIGPLMALGIAMVVGIWKVAGMPIVSSYPGVGMFGQLTNVGFYLPGTELANNLSTTPQMMQYVLFLTMLYLPLLFAFMLTRQRMIGGGGATMVMERHETERGHAGTVHEIGRGTETKTLTVAEQAKPAASGFRGFLESGLGRMTKAAMPTNLRASEPRGTPLMAGTTALPEQLALTNVRTMLDLASGGGEGSRNSHGKAIEKLAAASTMAESPERQTLMDVRHEIEERASRNDPEATRVLAEIQEREGSPTGSPIGGPMGAPIGEAQANVTIQPNIEIKTGKGENKPAQPMKTEASTSSASDENAEKARKKALEGEEETDEEKKVSEQKKRQKKEQNNNDE